MPTYEYECDACHEKLEEFQGINDPPLKKCPSCGKKKLRKMIGAGAGLIFKGSGFYSTDYRSKEYSDKAKSEKSSKSSDTSGGCGSSPKCDSCPAAKNKG